MGDFDRRACVAVGMASGGNEEGGVADEVLGQSCQPIDESRMIDCGICQRCEARADRQGCHFLIEVAQACMIGLLKSGAVIEDVRQFGFES